MSLFWKKFAGVGSPKLTQQQQSDNSYSKLSSPCNKSNTLPTVTLPIPLRQNSELPSYITKNGCIKRHSRLSQCLDDVVKDTASRSYFITFLESRGASRLLTFYLDVESFEACAESRYHSHSKEINKSARSNAVNENEAQSHAINESYSHSGLSSPEDTPSAHSRDNILLNLHKTVTDDAVKIFTHYLAKDSDTPIGISDEQRNEIAGKICTEDGYIDPKCFLSMQQFVYTILQREHFNIFLQSVYYCKYQLDVLTAGSVSIVDLLYNEKALVYFMEFMEQECQRDLVEFWLATHSFYQHYTTLNDNEYDFNQIQEDAMVIYEKYFSLQASSPLGFSDDFRFDVEQNICRVGGPLSTCFDSAIRLVLQVLEDSYLESFLGSQIYVKYLTELVNLVQTCSYQCERGKRAGSDASSDHSLHTVNTLLAMDGNQPGVASRKIIKKFEDEDMQIDTSQFVPDALWKRPLAGKLRFGYVNSMGQFIPDCEPEPDRRGRDSRFTKAVKKLVYKDEDTAKEEMALKVAKMVIHEVLSITLNKQFQFT